MIIVQMRQHVKLCKLVYAWARVSEIQSINEMRQLARGISFSYNIARNGSETKFVQLLFGIYQPLGANADAPTTCTFMHRKLQCHDVSEAQQITES